MSDRLWVIGVGVIDPWMNLVITMFPEESQAPAMTLSAPLATESLTPST